MTTTLEVSNLLKVSQVASLLNIHPNTVRRWSNNGILESYRIGSRGDRRFKKEDINILLFESWLFDYEKINLKRKDNLLVHA